jgi:hypothetical protein
MTKTAKLFLGGILFLSIHALKAQLPNASFENWKTKSFGLFSVSEPTGWNTSSLLSKINGNNGPLPVTRTTSSKLGQYAVLLKTIKDTGDKKETSFMSTGEFNLLTGDVNTKFKLAGEATKIRLYYKFNNPTNDEFSVVMSIYKNGEQVGAAIHFDSVATSEYKLLEIPVSTDGTNIADSASISIILGQSDAEIGAELYIDDISIVYKTTSTKNIEANKNTIAVFPNPAKDFTQLAVNITEATAVSASLLDLSGKAIFTILDNAMLPKGNNEIKIETAALQAGIYFVQVKTDTGILTKKLLID